MLAMLTHAGKLLRRDPLLELATQPLRPTRQMRQDVAAKALIDVINTSVERVEPDDTTFSVQFDSARDIDACPYAEIGFANTTIGLKSPRRMSLFDGSQIILNDQDEPIFIRKAEGVPSALSLQEFIVNGVLYPAGSITRLELDTDHREDDEVYPIPVAGMVEFIPAEAVTKVAFKRLSAYAFPVSERSKFGHSFNLSLYPNRTQRLQKIIKWLDMATLTELASAAYDEALRTA
jgi:hypothetical protein